MRLLSQVDLRTANPAVRVGPSTDILSVERGIPVCAERHRPAERVIRTRGSSETELCGELRSTTCLVLSMPQSYHTPPLCAARFSTRATISLASSRNLSSGTETPSELRVKPTGPTNIEVDVPGLNVWFLTKSRTTRSTLGRSGSMRSYTSDIRPGRIAWRYPTHGSSPRAWMAMRSSLSRIEYA